MKRKLSHPLLLLLDKHRLTPQIFDHEPRAIESGLVVRQAEWSHGDDWCLLEYWRDGQRSGFTFAMGRGSVTAPADHVQRSSTDDATERRFEESLIEITFEDDGSWRKRGRRWRIDVADKRQADELVQAIWPDFQRRRFRRKLRRARNKAHSNYMRRLIERCLDHCHRHRHASVAAKMTTIVTTTTITPCPN